MGLGERPDQRHNKSNEKCSISNAHGLTVKYWTVGQVSPEIYSSIITHYEITDLPLYCIESSVQTSMVNVATTYIDQG